MLNVHEDSACFFQQLATAEQRVLLVDYDSFMAALAQEHRAGLPYPTLAELLDCIMTVGQTRVVLITRRSRDVAAGCPGELEPGPLVWAGPLPDVWEEKVVPDSAPETAGGRSLSAIYSSFPQHLDSKIAAVLRHPGERIAVAFLSEHDGIYTALKDAGESQTRAVAFRTSSDERSPTPTDIIQFLVDWLRICGGEIC